MSKLQALLKRIGVSGVNKPKRTPSHPTKSHVVVAKEGDKVKTIRFGQQGVSGAGAIPKFWKWTSGVHKDKRHKGRECPAYKQDGQCKDCRACWDRKVKQVSYKEH